MMADDVWTDADITRRTEAMIRSEFPLEAETVLNRKVLGMSLGTYTPSDADLIEIARYNEVALAAQAAGLAARADMALLCRVFPLEDAQRRLDRLLLTAAWDRLQQPTVDPVWDEETGEVLNATIIAQDEAERTAASALVTPHLLPDGTLDPAAVEQDNTERAASADVIDSADAETLDLFERRRNARQAVI